MRTETSRDMAMRIREIVLADFDGGGEPTEHPSRPLWAAVRGRGSELWLDTGDIEDASPLWSREFSAFTTNNTLLNKEVQKGTYDELIARVGDELKGRLPERDMALEVAFVLNAYHALRIIRRFGAMVSVELHTDLADDVERSVAYGLRYHDIAPEGFYIKVPHTPAGLLAARRLSNHGVPVNYTLGFSARQNYATAAVARPAFLNVFLGRLNSFVAENGLGSGEMIGERATIASQQAVLELRRSRQMPTRQIAASMREGSQVLSLVGVDVLTMPTKVVREFEGLNPPLETITSQVGSLPDVEPAPGVDWGTAGVDVLWEVPQNFKQTVQELAEKDMTTLSPDDIGEHFAQRGFPDFLPQWSHDDLEFVTGDGKIPEYARWKDRLAARSVGLDALMNISALQAFAADQKAMDERIASLL